MKKILYFCIVVLPVSAFGQLKDFTLRGDVQFSRPVEWVYLTYVVDKKVVRDSLQPQDGKFTFTGKIYEPMTSGLRIKFQQGPGETRAQFQGTILFLEPLEMNFTAKDSMKNQVVTGSVGHMQLLELLNQQKTYLDKIGLLNSELKAISKEDSVALKNKRGEIAVVDKEMRRMVFVPFLEKNLRSPLALYILREYASNFDEPEKVEKFFVKLPKEVQQLPLGISIKTELEKAKTTRKQLG